MNQETSDEFWFTNPEILWHPDRLIEFFPTRDQTLEERFNALIRLSFYCAVILFVYHNGDYKYWSILFGTLLVTYYVYTNRRGYTTDTNILRSRHPDKIVNGSLSNLPTASVQDASKKSIERLENVTDCTKPSIDNPFMNVTMGDYLNVNSEYAIVDRPQACDLNDPTVKREADTYFNNNLFRDVNDVFGKTNSERQFYTMPSTTIPNRQDEFAKWLYLNPKTCKEDQNFCTPYEDLRAKRPVFYDPTKNPIKTEQA